MTEREALKLALEALKESDGFLFNWHENFSDDEADAYAAARQLNEQAITAAKEALAQPEQCKYGQEPKSCTSSPMDCQCALDATFAQPEQEPYAWEFAGTIFHDRKEVFDWYERGDISDIPPLALYTTPPQRTWVGLTDEDKKEYVAQDFGGNRLDAMDWAEKRLKEKNT